MPIGGERIGSAYIRIHGDGSGLSNDIRQDLERSEPEIRTIARRMGEAYDEEFQGGLTRDDSRDFGRGLRENLERALAERDLSKAYFESEDWKRFRGRLHEQFGDAGEDAAESLERRFRESGSNRGLSQAIRDVVSEVTRAQRAAADSQHDRVDLEFQREVDRLAELARLQDDAAAENTRRDDAALQKQREDRDRDFDRETERLAELARLQDAAAEEDVRRTRETQRRQSEDRDRAFDLEIARQRDYQRLFDEAAANERESQERRGREIIAINRRVEQDRQRLLRDSRQDINDLTESLRRLSTNERQSGDSRSNIARDIERIRTSLAGGSGRDHDVLIRDLDRLHNSLRRSHPEIDRMNDRLTRLADLVGRGFGRGSRNNFLNFLGNSARGLTNLLTLAPKVTYEIGRKMVDAFQSGQGALDTTGKVVTALVSGLGSLVVTGVAVVTVVALLVTVLGPLAALISGITAAVVALAASLSGGLIAGVVGLGGALVPLIAAAGVGALAFFGMSDVMKKRLTPEVDRLRSAFGSLAKTAGDEIGRDLLKALEGLAPVLRGLQPLVAGIANGLGDFAVEFADSFKSAGFKEGIRALTDGPRDAAVRYNFLANQIRHIGEGITDLAGGLGGFFLAARPLIRDTVNGFRDLASNFNEFANSKEGRADIRKFLANVEKSASSLADLLGQAARALGDLILVGSGPGNTIIDDLTSKVRDFADYLTNPKNRNSIKDFFANGVEIARDLGRAVLYLVDLIGDLDTDESRKQLQEFFDTLGDIGGAIKDLIPFLRSLADIFGVYAAGIQFAVDAYQAIYEVLKAIVTLDFSGVGGRIGDLVGSLGGLSSAVGDLFGAGSDMQISGDFVKDLNGIVDAASAGKSSFKDLNSTVGDYISTLDGLTGASTKATRAIVSQNIAEADLGVSISALGLTQGDIINATLGRADAQERVNAAIANAGDSQAARDVAAFTGAQIHAIAADRERARQTARNLEDFKSLRREISQPLYAKLSSEQIEPTKKGIAEVVAKYKELNTAANIKKLIAITGVDATVKDIRKIIENLKNVEDVTPHLDKAKTSINRDIDSMRTVSERGGKAIADKLNSGTAAARPNLDAFIRVLHERVDQQKAFASSGGIGIGGALGASIERGLSGTVNGIAAQAAAAVRAAIGAARAAATVNIDGGGSSRPTPTAGGPHGRTTVDPTTRSLAPKVNADTNGQYRTGQNPSVGTGLVERKVVDASGWTITTTTADSTAVAAEVANRLMSATF